MEENAELDHSKMGGAQIGHGGGQHLACHIRSWASLHQIDSRKI